MVITKGMSKVFECSTDNISLHLKHIFEDNELDKKSVTEKCSLTADDGKNYNTTIYSDDYLALKNLFNDMYAKDISKK